MDVGDPRSGTDRAMKDTGNNTLNIEASDLPPDRDERPISIDLTQYVLPERGTGTSNTGRPSVISWIGRPEPNPNQIRSYFEAGALLTIVSHSLQNPNVEVGGVLVGKVFRDQSEYVIVTGSIPAKQTVGSRISLTFTLETWEEIYRDHALNYPGTVILGWYHTHPGHGIFLSNRDEYIHRNFFSNPNQLAVVVDPRARTCGVFRLDGMHLYRNLGIPITGDPEAFRHASSLLHQSGTPVPQELRDEARRPVKSKRVPEEYRPPGPVEDIASEFHAFKTEVKEILDTIRKEFRRNLKDITDTLDNLQSKIEGRKPPGSGREGGNE